MCSNCALRSGWCEPSSALRFTWREKPSTSVSSLPTVFALILCPISLSARASFSRLFETHRNGRTGEPSVAGSTRRLRSSTTVGSVYTQRLAAATLAPHAAVRQRPLVEVVLAAVDGRAGDAGDARDHLESTVAGGLHLARRPQPSTALVQLGAYRLPPPFDAILVNLVDHGDAIRVFALPRNPPESIRHAHRLRFTCL